MKTPHMKLLPAYLKWVLMFFAQYFMILVTYILAPVLPLFALNSDKLPTWLSWFQTPRDPLDGSHEFQRNYAHLSKYRLRVKWLIRNPAYGFSHDILGTKCPEGMRVFYNGDIKTHETHTGSIMMWSEDYKFFCYKKYSPSLKARAFTLPFFGKVYYRDMIVKFRIGWKLHQWAEKGEAYGHQRKYLATFNPLKQVD